MARRIVRRKIKKKIPKKKTQTQVKKVKARVPKRIYKKAATHTIPEDLINWIDEKSQELGIAKSALVARAIAAYKDVDPKFVD